MIGKYIYGIINSNEEQYFGHCGMTAYEEAYSISYKDISAVISDSEIVDFTFMRKDALVRQLVRHQKIAERIMSQEYTAIPMRLGTFGRDNDEIKYILIKAYSVAKNILEMIKDKIEFDVAATWSDFNSVLKEVSEEPDNKDLKEKLQSNPKGKTVDDQIRVGIMVKNALDKKRERYAQKVQDVLKALSHNSKAHELMDDKMVINAAYLIDKTRHKDFEEAVGRLNSEFGERLNFRCVGPLPPYSFYTLEIKKIQSQDVVWAKNKLNLNVILFT